MSEIEKQWKINDIGEIILINGDSTKLTAYVIATNGNSSSKLSILLSFYRLKYLLYWMQFYLTRSWACAILSHLEVEASKIIIPISKVLY